MLKRRFDLCDSPDSSTPPRPPLKRVRVNAFSASWSSCPSTPAYYPHTPSDSPTNPFGRFRKLMLLGEEMKLPKATSFSKHLPLRLQLVRSGKPTRTGEGTYRIVQVPLNYTIRLLHKLLLFLFGVPDLSSSSPSTSTDSTSPQDASFSSRDSHLFEVLHSIRTYKPNTIRPGHIKSSCTWAKLSSAHHPFKEDGEDWLWQDEEDFTLSHVWPEGGDLARGLIYHHTPTTSIHITINTRRLTSRKGVGNKPFVFEARGVCTLIPSADIYSPEIHADGDVEPTGRWNTHLAFEKFLEREGMRDPPLVPTDTEDSDSEEPNPFITQPHYLPSVTPAPNTKAKRLRVEYAMKRIERLNKKGLKELDDDDDEAEEEDELTGEEADVC